MLEVSALVGIHSKHVIGIKWFNGIQREKETTQWWELSYRPKVVKLINESYNFMTSLFRV